LNWKAGLRTTVDASAESSTTPDAARSRRPATATGMAACATIGACRALRNTSMSKVEMAPTTALEVTIQAQILDLMRELKQKIDAAIVLITHDLGVVAEMAQRVVVMYAGRKAEEAPVGPLFRRPVHPYTKGLLNSMPRLGATLAGERAPLAEIPGTVPSLREMIPGCPFEARCTFATDLCRREMPQFEEKEPGHFAACFHSDQVARA